jgi:site-specific DNA-methyltransferase (adenine-specific)
MYSLHNGDCLPWLKSLESASVDCVFVDLPYFGVVSDDWDNQWKDRNEYLDWVVSLAHEWKRITKSNSSIFVFCDEKMEAYIQVRLDEIFLLLNKIVWYRKTNEMKKFAHNFRTFAPATERALYYTTKQDVTGLEAVKLDMANFSTLRQYFKEFQEALGLNIKQINSRLGHRKAEHAFYWNSTQWDLPTPETYQELIALNPNHGFQPKEYEALRLEYEALRRPFNADNKTFDVLEFPAYDDSAGILEHATPKPVSLCRRIISVITNPDQVVLDCCMGLGSAGVAAIELGRHFLGCELKANYFAIAEKRIKKAAQSPSFYTLPNNRLQPTAFGVGTQAQFPLLGSSQAEESSATHGGG